MKAARIVVALAALLCAPLVWAQGTEDVVAKLGTAEIRIADLQKLLDTQPPEVRDQLLKSPPALDRLVRSEVYRRALIEEARTKGWDKRADVAVQMDRARDQVLLTSYMNELARPPAEFPNDKELAAAYNANQAEFALPRQFRVAQIFVAVPKDAPKAEADKLRKKADDIAKRGQSKDADFARLAQANSDHKASAEQGGDLGWMAERDMIPEMRTLIPTLAKGEVGKPVRTEQGWHIIKLLDLKPASVRPLAEVRVQLAAAMRQRLAQENEKRYLDKLAEQTPVAINEIALGKLRAAPGKP